MACKLSAHPTCMGIVLLKSTHCHNSAMPAIHDKKRVSCKVILIFDLAPDSGAPVMTLRVMLVAAYCLSCRQPANAMNKIGIPCPGGSIRRLNRTKRALHHVLRGAPAQRRPTSGV